MTDPPPSNTRVTGVNAIDRDGNVVGEGDIDIDMSNWDGSFISEQPSIMAGPGEVPTLAAGSARQHGTNLSMMPWLLKQQQDQYGDNQQPPVAVQQAAYEGPALRFLLDGRRVKFCYTKEEVIRQYQTLPEESGHAGYYPVPEYAALVQGPTSSGVVRARINTTGHAPSAIMATVADKLGLRRHPLRGPGMVASVPSNGQVTALEVLDDPLTLQLLAGPGNAVMEITLATVLVVPNHMQSDTNVPFELQLGLFDFVRQVHHQWVPLWASQFEVRDSGFRCAVPVVAPLPPNVGARLSGSSTFHITQESYEEVLELQMTRQRVRARRAAAAAAAAGDSAAPAPAEAAAGVLRQAVLVGPPSTAMLGAAAGTQAPAAGTQAWVDEWAPPPRQQQQGRGGGRRGGRGRGRGRSRGRQRVDADTAVPTDDAAAAAGEAVNAAQSVAQPYAHLDPLPDGLVACSWEQVAATALPERDDICVICLESMSEDTTRLVTQLRCRHTYCVICLRDHNTARNFKQQPLTCPQCRQEV